MLHLTRLRSSSKLLWEAWLCHKLYKVCPLYDTVFRWRETEYYCSSDGVIGRYVAMMSSALRPVIILNNLERIRKDTTVNCLNKLPQHSSEEKEKTTRSVNRKNRPSDIRTRNLSNTKHKCKPLHSDVRGELSKFRFSNFSSIFYNVLTKGWCAL